MRCPTNELNQNRQKSAHNSARLPGGTTCVTSATSTTMHYPRAPISRLTTRTTPSAPNQRASTSEGTLPALRCDVGPGAPPPSLQPVHLLSVHLLLRRRQLGSRLVCGRLSQLAPSEPFLWSALPEPPSILQRHDLLLQARKFSISSV